MRIEKMICNEFYCKYCPKRLNYPSECLLEASKKMTSAAKKYHFRQTEPELIELSENIIEQSEITDRLKKLFKLSLYDKIRIKLQWYFWDKWRSVK